MSRTVKLIDGPLEGMTVEVEGSGGLNVEGENFPAGHVAYYRPTRNRDEYRFKGYSKVLARIPWPISTDEMVDVVVHGQTCGTVVSEPKTTKEQQ